MKSSIIRGFLLFAAGAGCATVVAGYEGAPPITVEDFQARLNKVLVELADLGRYPVFIDGGRVGINIAPYTCGPKPPIPKQPAYAVDPFLLSNAVQAATMVNQGYWVGEVAPVFEDGKCKPYN